MPNTVDVGVVFDYMGSMLYHLENVSGFLSSTLVQYTCRRFFCLSFWYLSNLSGTKTTICVVRDFVFCNLLG